MTLNRRTTTNEAIDGDLVRYNEMQALADRGLTTPEAYAEMQRYVDIDNLIGSIRESLPEDAMAGFEEDFAGIFGPISKILMGNQFTAANTQQATLIVFIEGGTE